MAYCSKCGKLIDGGSAYCPNCGAAATDRSDNPNQNWINNYGPNSGQQQSAQGLGGTLTIILVLGILWAIGSIIVGIFCFAGSSLYYFLPGGAAIMAGLGVLCLVGGIFAMLSCMYIYKQENHQQAFLFCLFGSIIALVTGGVIAGIIGIIFAFLLKNEKYRFKS